SNPATTSPTGCRRPRPTASACCPPANAAPVAAPTPPPFPAATARSWRVSSAPRDPAAPRPEPLPGADLPALTGSDVRVVEAAPNPPPGSDRDLIAALTEARVAEADATVATAIDGYLDRLRGVVRARAQGPTARRDTKWWNPRPIETKSIDVGYVFPDRIAGEIDA